MPDQSFEDVRRAMTRTASLFKVHDIPFALAGGLAAWVRGGPESTHDVDFYVLSGHVEEALELLEEEGMRVAKPVEAEWLYKAWDGDVLIDLIFRPQGPAPEDVLSRAEPREVDGVKLPVMQATDILISRLASLSELYLDLQGPLKIARSLREQIDWEEVSTATKGSPFAAAFLTLVRELGIADHDT